MARQIKFVVVFVIILIIIIVRVATPDHFFFIKIAILSSLILFLNIKSLSQKFGFFSQITFFHLSLVLSLRYLTISRFKKWISNFNYVAYNYYSLKICKWLFKIWQFFIYQKSRKILSILVKNLTAGNYLSNEWRWW